MSDTKKSIYKKWWFWLLTVFIFFMFIGAFGSGPVETIDTPATDTVQDDESVAIIDTPRILSMTIDEVRDELGMPLEDSFIDPTSEQIYDESMTWMNEYEISDYMFVIEWNATSRNVTGVFVATDDPSGATKDWEVLVPLLGLPEDTSDYLIDAVEVISDPSQYTGVNVSR